MKRLLKKYLFGIKSKPKSKIQILLDNKRVEFGKASIFESISVNLRIDNDKTYLKVGENSIVNGNYYFENEKGKILIGNRTFVGGGKFICINKIEIGNDVLISWDCTFMDNNAHSLKWSERKNDVKDWKTGLEENKIGFYKNWNNVKSAPIIVKDKAWIGFEVVVLKGVTIGEGAIVASRSVVTKDVPDWTIVAGNPAQIMRTIPENER